MDRYRLIIDGRTEFAVEITNERGDIHVTGGFHTLLAADAWMANRQDATEVSERYRFKLRSRHRRNRDCPGKLPAAHRS